MSGYNAIVTFSLGTFDIPDNPATRDAIECALDEVARALEIDPNQIKTLHISRPVLTEEALLAVHREQCVNLPDIFGVGVSALLDTTELDYTYGITTLAGREGSIPDTPENRNAVAIIARIHATERYLASLIDSIQRKNDAYLPTSAEATRVWAALKKPADTDEHGERKK